MGRRAWRELQSYREGDVGDIHRGLSPEEHATRPAASSRAMRTARRSIIEHRRLTRTPAGPPLRGARASPQSRLRDGGPPSRPCALAEHRISSSSTPFASRAPGGGPAGLVASRSQRTTGRGAPPAVTRAYQRDLGRTAIARMDSLGPPLAPQFDLSDGRVAVR